MKRAALVVATSVALLLSVVSVSVHAATRKHVSMPSDGQVIGSGNGSSKSGTRLSVPGNPIEGEYIPSSYGGGSKGTKLPIKPTYDYSIPRTVKGMTTNLRGGVYGAVLGIGLQYMLDAVDGVIEDGQVKIRAESQPVPGGYYWKCPQVQCTPQLSLRSAVENSIIVQGIDIQTHNFQFCDFVSETYGYCVYRIPHPTVPDLYSQVDYVANRFGTGCSEGSTYNTSTGACESAGGLRPATDADYDLMEAAAAAKDSEWLKERLREHCEGSLNPQGCYESLRDNTWLEGPASVTEPGPTTTTTSPAGTTTTTGNTKIDITYGDNYYDYRKTKTTIVTKPDGTTETTTETEPDTEEPKEEQPEEMPAVTDLYKPYIDKLNDIKTDVSAPPAVVSPIGWSAWYSFGGGCSEITAELPLIGSWSTNYCPYIYDWVRPILAFIFVVFTWHYCRELWSEAVTQARPM